MSKAVALLLCCTLAMLGAQAADYTSRYDVVDVDRILQNGRVLSNYIKCMLGEGACTPEGRELKKTLPDALATGCTKCNEKQKETAEKVIRHLMTKRPGDWDKLVRQYDPKGEFKKRYEANEKKL